MLILLTNFTKVFLKEVYFNLTSYYFNIIESYFKKLVTFIEFEFLFKNLTFYDSLIIIVKNARRLTLSKQNL